jgi:hypothetical protein
MIKTHFGTIAWGGRLAVLGLWLAGCPEDGKVPDEKPDASAGNGTEDGGTTDGGSGPLSCDERHDGAMQATMAALARHGACTRDEECVTVQADHGCQGSCGFAVNGAKQAPFEQDLADIDAQYCASYIEDGCAYATPDCAINYPVCDQGTCALAYDEGGCEPAAESVLLGARRSFGECAGACTFELVIGAGLGACSEVALSISGPGAPDPLAMNRGDLTSAGVFRTRRLAELLEGVELAPTYGCPDCADGGASRLFLRRQGVESMHDYDFMDPPAVLADADAFLQGLIDALRSCQGNDSLTPAADCTASPSARRTRPAGARRR